MYPDVFHKISRKTGLAIGLAPGGESLLRRLNRLFRVLRGPWHTCRFGKMIAEARVHLTKQLEANNAAASDLVELYLPSICRDLGVAQQSHSRVQVLDILKRKGGQGKRLYF